MKFEWCIYLSNPTTIGVNCLPTLQFGPGGTTATCLDAPLWVSCVGSSRAPWRTHGRIGRRELGWFFWGPKIAVILVFYHENWGASWNSWKMLKEEIICNLGRYKPSQAWWRFAKTLIRWSFASYSWFPTLTICDWERHCYGSWLGH